MDVQARGEMFGAWQVRLRPQQIRCRGAFRGLEAENDVGGGDTLLPKEGGDATLDPILQSSTPPFLPLAISGKILIIIINQGVQSNDYPLSPPLAAPTPPRYPVSWQTSTARW